MEVPGKKTLVARVLQGDRAAIGVLYDRYHSLVRRIAYSLDPRGAEDRIQVALLKVLELLRDPGREFDEGFPERLTCWVIRIVKNVAAGERRRRGPSSLSLDDDEPGRAPGEPEARLASPTEAAAREEVEGILREQVRSLPSMYRDVLDLYFFKRRSQKEIAEELGVEELVVRKRMERAYRRLRSGLRSVATTLWRAAKRSDRSKQT
jgi:RNA polymerase sigma-70 factor (ECF subfamily)